MFKGPDFMIMGAMKSATTFLHQQLAYQTGIFIPDREVNFFSDDHVFSKGIEYYSELFSAAEDGAIIGERSTHYTKLPTYPETVERMQATINRPKFIYILRDPLDRLVSQYIHQWSEREISCGLDEAVHRHPELVHYSCYSYQLAPYFERFGDEAVLPVFHERLAAYPDDELRRVCRFIGYGAEPSLSPAPPANESRQRIRKFPLYRVLVDSRLATEVRRGLVPKAWRRRLAQRLTMGERPVLGSSTRQMLEQRFDEDLAGLEGWLGLRLTCDNFQDMARTRQAPGGPGSRPWHAV